jgi:hypothetical protein
MWETKPSDGNSRAGWLLLKIVVVSLFVAAFVAMTVVFSKSASATSDEVAHLPAGYTYLRWHDYRLNPEHPPLIKKMAALPLLWRKDWPTTVDLSKEMPAIRRATSSEEMMRWSWISALDVTDREWDFGQFFLYGLRPEAIRRLHEKNPGIDSPVTVPSLEILSRKDFYADADAMLFWGRMSILLLGAALAMLIFSWSRELFGFAGGVLSLALFCFDPNFIAHSGLVTTDVGETLFFFGAIYFLWRTCRRWTAANVTLFLLFFGLAFVAKFSAILLLPIFWLAASGWLISPGTPAGSQGKTTFSTRVVRLAGLFFVALAVVYLAIWASYSFRYSAAADPQQAAAAERQILKMQGKDALLTPYGEWGHLPIEAAVRSTAALNKFIREFPEKSATDSHNFHIPDTDIPIGLTGRSILFAQRHELLPEAYIYGFGYTQLKSLLRTSFLLGDFSETGFRTYFIYTFLLKTPLPALFCVLTGIVLVIWRRVIPKGVLPFLIAPAVVYFAAIINSSMNIGHRHLLLIYPFLYVMAGSLAVKWACLKRPARIGSAVALLLAVVATSQIVFFPWQRHKWQVVAPHYLAYFNELAGGPGNGSQFLLDSNLDWGQDIGQLKVWLVEHGIKDPIGFCCFGTADPRFYGISHHNLRGGFSFEPQEGLEVLKPGCLIAISANNERGLLFDPESDKSWRNILDHAEWVDSVGYSISIYRFRGLDDKAPPAPDSGMERNPR